MNYTDNKQYSLWLKSQETKRRLLRMYHFNPISHLFYEYEHLNYTKESKVYGFGLSYECTKYIYTKMFVYLLSMKYCKTTIKYNGSYNEIIAHVKAVQSTAILRISARQKYLSKK